MRTFCRIGAVAVLLCLAATGCINQAAGPLTIAVRGPASGDQWPVSLPPR